jgi:hypothetical protein
MEKGEANWFQYKAILNSSLIETQGGKSHEYPQRAIMMRKRIHKPKKLTRKIARIETKNAIIMITKIAKRSKQKAN